MIKIVAISFYNFSFRHNGFKKQKTAGSGYINKNREYRFKLRGYNMILCLQSCLSFPGYDNTGVGISQPLPRKCFAGSVASGTRGSGG